MADNQAHYHLLSSCHKLGDSSLTVEENHLEKLHHLWSVGTLTKHQFIEAMYQYHSLLFQYSKRLHNNIVESLHITDHGVVITTRNGVKFACNPDDMYGIPFGAFTFGTVEQVAGDLLRRFMPKDGVFFDIGANVGWYALHLAQNSQSQIYAFEPLQTTYGWLQHNIAINGFHNVESFNVGLGEKEENMIFYFRPDMTGAASARNITDSEKASEFACNIRRLDDCWREIGRNPDLIKCDVEGAELFVFRGGQACLAEARPIIFCEMLRKWSAKFGYTPNDIINFLSKLGYACFEPAESALKVFERMTEDTMETNFFFLHREKHKALIHQYSDLDNRAASAV